MVMIDEAQKPQGQRTVPDLIEDIKTLKAEIQELYCLDSIPWVVGYSGGKDSTCVLQLIWNAIAELPEEKRTKPIHVLTTDTLVENPIVAAWMRQSLDRMGLVAKEQNLPFVPRLLQPEVKDTFWVNLIGKGYPAPRHMFRWCTERLKIWPSNRYIQNVVRVKGEVIVVLGTRKAESVRRAGVMNEHEVGTVGDRLKKTKDLKSSLLYRGQLPNSLVYSPLANWRDDEVWLYLMQFPNPWRHSNKDLFTLYRGATEDNECPFVIDTSTPSCGDSRFGCWVCTLVSEDKSMSAMIQNDDEKAWMQPLLDLRNELDIYDDHDRRDFRRMTGKVQLFERRKDNETQIVPIPGPYTRYWREEWLKRLLQAQISAKENAPEGMKNIELISPQELSEIRRIWREEKHEFDDSLPRIYHEITGQKFHDPRPSADTTTLGPDEWAILATLCDDDPMYLELVAKLLDTERKYQTMSRRTGIYKALQACFETSALAKAPAIQRAETIRDLKIAEETGDVETFQTAWATLKFGAAPSPDP
jgi:DNA sulfur modification protein DndC